MRTEEKVVGVPRRPQLLSIFKLIWAEIVSFVEWQPKKPKKLSSLLVIRYVFHRMVQLGKPTKRINLKR